MSLDPVLYYSLPEETARVARAAFLKGTVYMRMHDEFGAPYDNPSFAPLCASRGRLTASGEEVREVLIGEEGAELIAHAHIWIAGREGRAGDLGRLLRHRRDGLQM